MQRERGRCFNNVSDLDLCLKVAKLLFAVYKRDNQWGVFQ